MAGWWGTRRIVLAANGVYGLLILIALIGVWSGDGGVGRKFSLTNPLGNPHGMVDRLVMLEAQHLGSAAVVGSLDGVEASDAGVRLNSGGTEYPRQGMWTSREMSGEFGFTEVVPSWNVGLPPQTGIRFELRTRDQRSGRWSPWLYFGSWGRTPPARRRVTEYERGKVYIDNLVMERSADAWQVRAHLFAFDADRSISPLLRRLAVSYSGVVKDEEKRRQLTEPVRIEGTWARDLKVSFRTQQDAPKRLRGEICSPTSVSMVMQFWGVDRPTVENALAIYDAEYNLFGNWARAVQRAAELGLEGWLERFRNWEQVKAKIAAGQPVIASIAFGQGEFPSAVMRSTSGHLIVIRGFTEMGDVIVNDPASRDRGDGVVYKAEELGRAWFGHGGVGYIIRGTDKRPTFNFQRSTLN